MITGIVSVQIGSGLAGRMFGEVSPATLTVLRLWTAAIALAANRPIIKSLMIAAHSMTNTCETAV